MGVQIPPSAQCGGDAQSIAPTFFIAGDGYWVVPRQSRTSVWLVR